MQINKESVSDSLNNRVAVKFSNVFENDYSWTHFIEFINHSIKQRNPAASKTNFKETIGYVNFWHRLTMTLDNTSENYFPSIEEKTNFLQSFIDREYVNRFGAVSFTDSEPTTGKHSDPVTVMYWNCIGSVRWDVYSESGQQSFILSPGDVILVPHDITHEVTSLGPRAAISFMFEE
jgi:hypothetical protein